jgi:hypothetical protein
VNFETRGALVLETVATTHDTQPSTAVKRRVDMSRRTDAVRAGQCLMLRFSSRERQKHPKAQSSSVAQAARDFGAARLPFSHSPQHWSFHDRRRFIYNITICSRIAVSLRRYVECLVRWSPAGLARDGSLRPRFLLLLPASNPFLRCKTPRNTPTSHVHGVKRFSRV